MLIGRRELESRARAELAPYAQQDALSRGRRIPEAPDQFRTAFGRDRDRVIHSSAYRRLGNKTQVFVTIEGEYYRTRLTHTEEASQIALTVARALGVNPDLTEAICRVHDLGHAPFGHAGEAALADCMSDDGGFEHNAQTLRVVDVLEREYPEFPGLNLSWEVREGIAKHGQAALPGRENEFIAFPQPSLEAQIADTADAIAYGCHDLDDGLAAGLLQWGQLQAVGPDWWLAIRSEILPLTEALAPDLARRLLKRHLLNLLISDLIRQTGTVLDHLDPRSADDVRRYPVALPTLSPEVLTLRHSLHEFLTTYLYRQHHVETMWVKARRLIKDLFTSLDQAPGQLPPEARSRIDRDAPRRRIICDYIAEMTDRQAVREHSRLFQFDMQVLP
ncbi:MAG TPA: deoxyguanosinetriphosphate triphosphohydrolase [Chloroflexota bacterium]|nr:deoxyguanosinetriphosphate triphosphohydrolase [Chloroflexota bacterium]